MAAMNHATAPLPMPARPPMTRPPRELSDEELLASYRSEASDQAFGEIVNRHGAMVFRTCQRLLSNVHEAEDAAQAAFIVLARRPDAVRSSLAAWLHWAARNTASKVIRARSRRTRHEEEAARMRTKVDSPASAAPLREELDAALEQLPVAFREAVILRYLEGHDQKEAARLAGCPQGTLARRTMEGVEKLRAILQRRGLLFSTTALALLLAQTASAALPVMSLLPLKLAAARTLPAPAALHLAEGLLAGMFWAKAKFCTGIAAALVLLALSGTVAVRLTGTGGIDGAARGQEATGPVPAVRVLVQPRPGELVYCPADDVAFSPNGQVAASGRCDGTVRLWDAVTGQEKAVLRGHSTRVRPVVFSPDGKVFASGSFDTTVKLWDPASGREGATLKGHKALVWSLAFSPDGKTLASASWDRTIKLWDVPANKEQATLRGHAGSVYGIAFSPTGQLLASGGADGTVKLWDMATSRCRSTLATGLGEVMSVAFSPDGTTLAAATMTQGIRLFDVVSGRERCRIARDKVAALAYSPDSATLASAGLDGTTVLWDPTTGKEQARLDRAGGWSIAFAPDGQSLAVAQGGYVLLLNPAAIPRGPPTP